MADFCYACTRDVMGVSPEKNDMKGLCKPGEMVRVLCEGCGFAMVDDRGRCLHHARPVRKPVEWVPADHEPRTDATKEGE